ncbi:MAG: RNA methyltransferase [Candidatus Aminicenantaceae bacterium]
MGFQPDSKKIFRVILVRPQSPENIGLVARAMKNAGFADLHLVHDHPVPSQAHITAVHAEDILHKARICASVGEAVSDLDVVFAAVARHRKNFPSLALEQALGRLAELPSGSRIGFLFGNERTGLESTELRHSNFRFTLPQASVQPSYNLASAVLLTLFHVSRMAGSSGVVESWERPLPRSEQEGCIRLILQKLEEKRFIRSGNRRHMDERIHDLFGRLAMTAADRDLLLAIFGKR